MTLHKQVGLHLFQIWPRDHDALSTCKRCACRHTRKEIQNRVLSLSSPLLRKLGFFLCVFTPLAELRSSSVSSPLIGNQGFPLCVFTLLTERCSFCVCLSPLLTERCSFSVCLPLLTERCSFSVCLPCYLRNNVLSLFSPLLTELCSFSVCRGRG